MTAVDNSDLRVVGNIDCGDAHDVPNRYHVLYSHHPHKARRKDSFVTRHLTMRKVALYPLLHLHFKHNPIVNWHRIPLLQFKQSKAI